MENSLTPAIGQTDYSQPAFALSPRVLAGVALALGVLALCVALATRPGARAASAPSNAALEERIADLERQLGEVRASIAAPADDSRTVADRVLVLENKEMLAHETLADIVELVRGIEQRVDKRR